MENNKPEWLKAKGYLHLTPQIDINKNSTKLISRIQSPSFINSYSFYPLIHTVIKERRYKKVKGRDKPVHKYKLGKIIKRTAKKRPLHYATHMDALIYGYYAKLIQTKYEAALQNEGNLSSSITAYRKIPTEIEGKFKGTIHFAKEAFDEIKQRTNEWGECAVLTFDIESFFSTLNHSKLEEAWRGLFGFDTLPGHHKKVFRATTSFSYVLLNDLKKFNNRNYFIESDFNEKRLAKIRNHFGRFSFFESTKAFRKAVKQRELPIYRNSFHHKGTTEIIGIPQGLPISAILANLYLLEFDRKVIKEIVDELGGFYRRYSDDIVVVCQVKYLEKVKVLVRKLLEESLVKLSDGKTEVYRYALVSNEDPDHQVICEKIKGELTISNSRFIYLGFEFDGNRTFIKSANLARFYRKMKHAVRSKARLALKIASNNPGAKPVIFKRQLYDLYSYHPLTQVAREKKYKKLERNSVGEYRIVVNKKEYKDMKGREISSNDEQNRSSKRIGKSNYLTYVERASRIMEEPAILRQLRNHKKLLTKAISFRLKFKD